MHRVCQKFWLAIASTWRSSARSVSWTPRLTRWKTTWRFLKSARSVISMLSSRWLSCHASPSSEMAWAAAGVPIEVSTCTRHFVIFKVILIATVGTLMYMNHYTCTMCLVLYCAQYKCNLSVFRTVVPWLSVLSHHLASTMMVLSSCPHWSTFSFSELMSCFYLKNLNKEKGKLHQSYSDICQNGREWSKDTESI